MPGTPRIGSKRRSADWIASTFYLKRDTKARLEGILWRLKAAGIQLPADQSEVVDAALKEWLDRNEDTARLALIKKEVQ